jgi:hypothetical protein
MKLLLLRLLVFYVYLSSAFSRQHSTPTSLSARIQQITGRSAWSHNWSLPLSLLKRAYGIVGDDSRLRAFVKKLVLGQPVSYAHLGGSISVFGLAKAKEGNWHGIWHKWMELAFTPCGDLHPNLSPRDQWPDWGKRHYYICAPPDGQEHPIILTNHAVGATSCILAEKCIVQRVNKSVDLVLIEYTLNAMAGVGGESLDTPERRALERLLRKLLLFPSPPAIALLHCYSVNYGAHFAPMIEDWHDHVARYYGVQSISQRAVVYGILKRHNVSAIHDPLEMFMGDGLHPGRFGHQVLADIMIYTLMHLAKEVMGELLLEELIEVQQRQTQHVALHPRSQLPEPLIPGNWEHSDGFCLMGLDLMPVAHNHQGWEWIDESLWTGRHKYGFVSRTVGAKLFLQLDTSLKGLVSGSNRTQVMIGYLSSYERVGRGGISCVSGCICDSVEVNALWVQRYSTTNFVYLSVTPHQSCMIQIEVLPSLSRNASSPGDTKFKIEGVIVNQRPYLWSKGTDAGAQIDLMTSDLLNHIQD